MQVNQFEVYLIHNRQDMLVSGDVEVKDVIVVLSIQLVRNADKWRASGLRNPVVYDHHVIFAVCGDSGGTVLQRHNDGIGIYADWKATTRGGAS